jgi:hypothetical protein
MTTNGQTAGQAYRKVATVAYTPFLAKWLFVTELEARVKTLACAVSSLSCRNG